MSKSKKKKLKSIAKKYSNGSLTDWAEYALFEAPRKRVGKKK